MKYHLKRVLSILFSLVLLVTNAHANVDTSQVGQITFKTMGFSKGILFAGGQKEAGIDFYLPIDVLVKKAKLILDIKTNNKNMNGLSSLSILVNGQSVGEIPLNSVNLAKTTYELDIPALLVNSSNNVSFKILGDGQDVMCIDRNTASTVQLLPTSKLTIEYRPLNIAADLHSFPQPFWDSKEMLGRDVTFVFPQHINAEQVSSAAILASWMGIESSYRGVNFRVLKGQLPESNGIVFGKPGQKIGALTLPDVAYPMLSVMDNPLNPNYKLLVVVGNTDAQLKEASYRLTQGGFAIQTRDVRVKAQTLPVSEPYDAPRWVSTQQPVLLKDLIQDGQKMYVEGVWHDSLNFHFRAAPDLFLWNGKTLPLNIDYRFPSAPWIDENNSFLNVVFNGRFLDDLSVNKPGFLENIWRTLGFDTRQENVSLRVEPYMLYGNNQLSLYFNLHAKQGTPCEVQYGNNITSSIGEHSTLDLSEARHFALLPNLSFFIGASFPFSQLADYSQTVLLLPQDPSVTQLETMMSLTAKAGESTGKSIVGVKTYLGVPAMRSALANKNILAVSSLNEMTFINDVFHGTHFSLSEGSVHVAHNSLYERISNWLRGDFDINTQKADRYLSSNQHWRGFISFESPWQSKKLVVMALATSDNELGKLPHDLRVRQVNADITGDVSVITDQSGARSFRTASQFSVGELSWLEKIMWYARAYSSLFAITVVVFAFFIGIIVYRLLCMHAFNRLK